MASRLLKAIGVAEERRKASIHKDDMETIEGDFYEYEEGVPEEERGKNRRFDDVDRLEYELPSDFEDEEIDEEAAFGRDEDDAGIQRVWKKRSKEIDLNSDDGNEDDEEASEDEDDMEDDEEGQEEEKISDGSDEEDEKEEEEDNDNNDRKHRLMIEAVTGKSTSGVPDRRGRCRKDRVLSETYPESEFNLNPSSLSVNGYTGITVEDLMTPLHDKAGFGTIRKRMQELQKRGAPVEAPLPKVIQERLNRKAAYDKTRDDITKWEPMVKRNREAPTLAFNKHESAPQVTLGSLVDTFKPTTDFQKEIYSLLRESKLEDDGHTVAAEELELNKLSVDDVQERKGRLEKMRNLLFRHEVKSKRVKKIKSKAFHRLLQKDQKSKAEVDAAIAGADPEAAKAAAMKREFNRAQERMTLKHKNSSRWAKRILKRGLKASENDGSRDAIAEQLRTHAALTRKIQSATLSDSDDASSDSEEERDDVVPGLVLGGTSRSKVLAKAKLATLKALEDGNEVELPTSGLFSLPFMARAIEKKKRTAQNDAMAILEQLEEAEEEGNILSLDDDYSRSQNGQEDEATISGRVSFGKAKQANARVGRRDEVVNSEVEEESSEEFVEEFAHRSGNKRVHSNRSSSTAMKILSRANHDPEDDKGIESRSHLQADTQQRDATSQSGRVSAIGVETVPAKKVEVSIAGTQKKPPVSRVLVEEAKSLTKGSGTVPNGSVSTHNGNNVTQSTFSDDENDSDVPGVDLLDASGSQQDLIRQAFAGDDVEAEFQKMKSRVLDEEVPQGEGPVSLPGWGQWTRVQQKQSQPMWLVKEQEQLKRKRENTMRKRKDANLKHVIICEKLDKKAAKFMSASVPFPFSSKEVYERTIRHPIGRDYNTDKAYRDMIRPAVIKRAGVIIDPSKLDKSLVKKNETQGSVDVVKRKGTTPHVEKRRATTHVAKRKGTAHVEKSKATAHVAKRKRHQ